METSTKKSVGRGKATTITSSRKEEEDTTVRKGPWTMEEDFILFNYIINHGEGLWNSVAKTSGLKRTGKSCRLRWLNYLRPDVRRGNITAEEQLLIIQLHDKLGNRWSKIAKHLPGRTDNEIKNFWRTKIQRHMKVVSSSSSANHNNNNNNIMNHHNCSRNSQGSEMTTEQGSSSKAFDMAEMTTATTSFTVDQSNDNYWNVEDLWPLQLLNADHPVI